MIRFLVMDVDGTLTDGKVYVGDKGEILKVFDIKDGCGISVLLPKYGIIPVIITARDSKILLNRCKALGITEVYQQVREKLNCLKKILAKYSTSEYTYSLKDVAYIGDDIIDIDCLESVRSAGGIAACPFNAIPEVIECCDYVAPHDGGDGAVRDFVEYIIATKSDSTNSNDISKRINEVIDYISKLDFNNLKIGRYDVSEDFYYNVIEYEAFDESEVFYESHKKHVDIQWLVSGCERLYVNDVCRLKVKSYNPDDDVVLYESVCCEGSTVLIPGSCVILMPNDAHKSGRFMGRKNKILKVVGKLLI